jgi:radical SAM protein with 4Fe4S-binding SPASM domain
MEKQPKIIYGKKKNQGLRKNLGDKILTQEFGAKYSDYRKQWLKASERKTVTDFPLYLQIEHTGKCNLRCPTCVQGISSLRERYSQGFQPLDIKLYKKIIKEAEKYHCPSISFHNNDEPLLLNDLEKRIEMAREAGFIDLIMTTNANLLDSERADNLLKSGLTKINFSVDACNEEDYGKIRIGGNFKTVLANIDYFMAKRKEMGQRLPIVRATCVLTRFTQGKMKEFREFWAKSVDVVEFQNFQAIKGLTEGLKPETALIDTGFLCNAPWQQLVIRANGDILPCCSFYGTALVIGNVSRDSLYSVWHSQKMKEIRKELLKNNFSFSPVCRACAATFYVF